MWLGGSRLHWNLDEYTTLRPKSMTSRKYVVKRSKSGGKNTEVLTGPVKGIPIPRKATTAATFQLLPQIA